MRVAGISDYLFKVLKSFNDKDLRKTTRADPAGIGHRMPATVL
jgi:hypothetical protein